MTLLTVIQQVCPVNVPKDNTAGMGGFPMGVTGIVFIEIIMKMARIKRNNVGETDE